ncbi:37308_t:CDS:2, partial [Gigaspora margarita]
IKNYGVAKNKAENEYNEKLNKTFRVACTSDDYGTAFDKVKYKIEICLLGGISCEQDISHGQELIKKASELGLTSAKTWVK